jgi:hypothetical protein
VSANKINWLRLEHEAQVKDLRPQAGKVPGLEAELAKVKDAESELRLEFAQWLAKEKEELLAKYDAKAEELLVA